MNTPKHTPGVWSRNIKPARKYNCIFAGRNTHVCYLATGGLTDEEIEANAALIAQAPALLGLAQGYRAYLIRHNRRGLRCTDSEGCRVGHSESRH